MLFSQCQEGRPDRPGRTPPGSSQAVKQLANRSGYIPSNVLGAARETIAAPCKESGEKRNAGG